MTYDTVEKSTQDADPIELFKFVGTYNTYRLTNYDQDVTNSDGTYTSITLERSEVESGTQQDTDISLDIQLPASHAMITEYAINVPPPAMSLQVFRVHTDNLDDTLLLWDGEVISWAIDGRTAKIKVPSIFSYLFDTTEPWPKYQGPCNHVLGDSICGVDMTSVANAYSTTVSAVLGNVLTLAASSFADGQCNGGEMIFTSGGERRMIISNTGTSFLVSSPFSSNLIVGSSVTVRRGCNHEMLGDCKNKFNNVSKFGGFPYVPDRNPYDGRL